MLKRGAQHVSFTRLLPPPPPPSGVTGAIRLHAVVFQPPGATSILSPAELLGALGPGWCCWMWDGMQAARWDVRCRLWVGMLCGMQHRIQEAGCKVGYGIQAGMQDGIQDAGWDTGRGMQDAGCRLG